VGRLGTRRDVA